MFKKLLSLAAVAMMAYSANAAEPVVLWQADPDAELEALDWQIIYKMTSEEALELIEPGDFLNMVVTGVSEGGWPQVALNKAEGGWPPYTNSGVGGQEYPLTVTFPVSNELYALIEADGVGFTGQGCMVSEISYTKGNPIGPYTVWFGNKECGWGNGVSLSKDMFENIAVGDQLVFYTSDESFQILLGAWNGLNLPAYAAASIENMTYENGVTTLTMIEEYTEPNEYEQGDEKKEFDVFKLIKENGVVMHGTTTLTRIDFVPAAEVAKYEILAAYEADVDKLLAYQAEVEPILYPEDGEEYSAEVVAAAKDVWYLVGDALMLVEDAYEEAEETGKYVSPLTSEIIEEIKGALKAFTTGINGIAIDGNAARYYNLQGVEVANPAAGQIYIRVANGKAVKVIK